MHPKCVLGMKRRTKKNKTSILIYKMILLPVLFILISLFLYFYFLIDKNSKNSFFDNNNTINTNSKDKESKSRLRKKFLKIRNKITDKERKILNLNFKLLTILTKKKEKKIAAYFSVRNELDINPLMEF